MTLIEAIRAALRRDDYARRTELAYLRWIRAYIRFHGTRHPRELGAAEVSAFLAHLANEHRAAAPTRKQAHHALLFLYKRVLGQSLPAFAPLTLRRSPDHPPPVLSPEQVDALLDRLPPPFRLIAELLYGSGLHLRECLALRLADLDLRARVIRIHGPASPLARIAPLPARSLDRLRAQVDQVTRLAVDAPPSPADLSDLYLFPAPRPTTEPATGHLHRAPLHPSTVLKAITCAARAADIPTRVTPGTLRNSFARRLLEAGHHLQAVQTVLGHKDRRSTRRHAHLAAGAAPVPFVSPLDLPPCPPHRPSITEPPGDASSPDARDRPPALSPGRPAA
ncbi:MAG: tyrosine-type recombinase/integrase [Byssovorax sp.]